MAWVMGVACQRKGHATEAARAVIAWLARRGLRPTSEQEDGETVWPNIEGS